MKVMAKAQLIRREPQDVEGRKPPLKYREAKEKETKSSLKKRLLERPRKLRGEAARKVNVHIGCIFAALLFLYAAVFMIFLYWEP
jgi:hypothetical protein